MKWTDPRNEHASFKVIERSEVSSVAMDIPLPPSPGQQGQSKEGGNGDSPSADRYSPSQITSDDDDLHGLPPPPPLPPRDSEVDPKAIPLPAAFSKPKVLPPISLLGGQRAKQRLKAFAAAKGGNVSFGLQKLSRTIKTSSKFHDEEEEEKEGEGKQEGQEEKGGDDEEEIEVNVAVRNLPPQVAAAVRSIEAIMDKGEKEEEEEGKNQPVRSASSKSPSRGRRRSGSDRRRSRSRDRRSSRRRSRSRERGSRSSRRKKRSRSKSEEKDLVRSKIRKAKSWCELREISLAKANRRFGGVSSDGRMTKARSSMVMVARAEVHPYLAECEKARAAYEVN